MRRLMVWKKKPHEEIRELIMKALTSGMLPYMFRYFLITVQCAGKLK